MFPSSSYPFIRQESEPRSHSQQKIHWDSDTSQAFFDHILCCFLLRAKKCSCSYIIYGLQCGTSSDGKTCHTLPVYFVAEKTVSTSSAFVVLSIWFHCLTVQERMTFSALAVILPFWSNGGTYYLSLIIQNASIMDTFDQIKHSRRNFKMDSTI